MKKFIIFLLTSLFAVGCSQIDELDLAPAPQLASTTSIETRAVTTFQKLANPYSLENMQAVYRTFSTKTLQPTHKYVRFLPSTKEQLDLLEEALDLELFDYPLDLDIPDGVEYVDPTIPEGEFTWQYCAVPANFSFPSGIQYEVLENAYIPADNEMLAGTRAGEEMSVSKRLRF